MQIFSATPEISLFNPSLSRFPNHPLGLDISQERWCEAHYSLARPSRGDCAGVMRKRWRCGAAASSAPIAANSFSIARADGARFIQVDCFRKLLADEIIAPRQFAVTRERLLDAVGVETAQCPRRMPRQQSLDLMALSFFLDRVHGQPLDSLEADC
jgi:hypothetical protein